VNHSGENDVHGRIRHLGKPCSVIYD